MAGIAFFNLMLDVSRLYTVSSMMNLHDVLSRLGPNRLRQ